MATVKDWIKVLIASVTTALVTIIITSVFAFPSNIKAKFEATNEKFIQVEQDAKEYTDKKLKSAIEYTDKTLQKHEKEAADKFESIKDNLDKQYEMIEFIYQRELNKAQ
jgi:hypothetical protein